MSDSLDLLSPDSLFVVRHGHAGQRIRFDQRDRSRRLDPRGRAEAAELARVLVGWDSPAILTSPFARCVETVEPLARVLGLELEGCAELMIGADHRETCRLLLAARPRTVVCTHREVIEALLGPAVECEKAGTLVVDRRAGGLSVLDYLPPEAGRTVPVA